MKLVCMSDLHQYFDDKPVPGGDLLVIAGDITNTGTRKQTVDMLDYIASLVKQYTHGVVLVAGNHDFSFQRDPMVYAQACEDRGITYLCESGCVIGGLSVWGSPYCQRFNHWAFMYDKYMEHRIWDRIPEDTDVLVTHEAPMGILDKSEEGYYLGSEGLRLAVIERVKPKVHIFGHIHEGYGTIEINGTRFVNASYCNAQYEPVNEPQEVEV